MHVGISSLRFVLCLGLAVVAGTSVAAPWRVEPADVLNPTAAQSLHQRFPSIEHADDLSELLTAMGTMQNFLRLEAFWQDGTYVFRGRKARPIGRIDLVMTTRQFKYELESVLQKYVGQVDSPDVEAKIAADAATFMQHKGFFRAQIAISSQEDSLSQAIRLRIDENEPCLIQAVEAEYELPPGLSFGLKIGDWCDLDLARQRFAHLDEQLRERGYFQRPIEKPVFIYDGDRNAAQLVYKGSLGPKVSFRINSPLRGIFDDDEALAYEIGDPEAVKSEIIKKYQAKGYDDVVVTGPVEQILQNRELRYNFDVKPGKAYTIESVQIEGNHRFTDQECLETFDIDSFFSRPLLNEDAVRQGIENLKARYQAEGYWDVAIEYPRVAKDAEKGTARLFYTIEESKRRVFAGLTVTGNHHLERDKIADEFAVKEGNPLDWSSLSSFEQKVRSLYHRQGYIYNKIKISLREHPEGDDVKVVVVLNVTEGVRARFGAISIVGLANTKTVVVERELRFKEGDIFDPDKVEETRRALINLGIFTLVNILPSDSGDTEERDLVPYTVTVVEGKPGNVFFGPGWSLVEGMRFGLQSSYNNLDGMNRQLFFRGTLSEEQQQDAIGSRTLVGRNTSVGYVEPYFLDYPVSAALTLNQKAEAAPRRWDVSRSWDLTFGHILRDTPSNSKISLSVGQKVNEEIAAQFQENFFLATGNVRTTRLGLRYSRDMRNDIAWPTSGYFTSIEGGFARLALGADLSYNFWEWTTSGYWSVFDKWVLVAGFALTAYEDVTRRGAPSVLPPSERLYAGGADTNRGYQQRSLGPVIYYNNPLTLARENEVSGGSRRSVFKLEMRYQVIKDTFAISTFLDASTTFLSRREANTIRQAFDNYQLGPGEEKPLLQDNYDFQFESILRQPSTIWNQQYTSYGIAGSYLTPLGSLNLSYGLPWKRCPNVSGKCEKERGSTIESGILGGVFYLNVGANF